MNAKFSKKTKKIRYCTVVLFGLERVNPKVRYDFRSPNPKFALCAYACSKNSRGLNINIFVKTGMKLPFTLKNQHQKNVKFEFLELFSPEKRVFWFLKKPPCVSALIQLTVALLSWATWAIRSQLLICPERSERIAHCCSLKWAILSEGEN